MVLGDSGIITVAQDWNRPIYEPSKRALTWPNGTTALCFSAEESSRLRGPQFNAAWADEMVAWADDQGTWDMMQFGLRLGKHPRVFVSTTPKPTKLIKDIVSAPDTFVTRGSTYDNAENLAPTFLAAVKRRYEGTSLGRQELLGELLFESEKALWSRDTLDKTRVKSAPPMKRIVIAIDPSASDKETSDECGLVAAGRGEDDHIYVLEDSTERMSPQKWGQKALGLLQKWKGDRIVCEINNGGSMVERVIRTSKFTTPEGIVDGRFVPVRNVTATKGKFTRAEPVSALFEQGRAHMVGVHTKLEDQLVEWEPLGRRKSPDRLDAMVWAITELAVINSGHAFW
jgi:phage terminase large subunit-like protein